MNVQGFASKLFAALMCAPTTTLAVCFVTPTGSASNTGSEWSSPYDLQSGLADAACSETWVAAGVYFPASNGSPSASFTVTQGHSIYGGFAGTETLRSQRDPLAHVSVLSGDVDHNDMGSNGVDDDASQIVGDNSYHVVVVDGVTDAAPVGPDTVIDGFTITGGSAFNANFAQVGGGLLCFAFSGGECSPTLSRLIFIGNSAVAGAAIYNVGTSSARILSSTFIGNEGTGVIVNDAAGGVSSPLIANCTMTNNSGAVIVNQAASGTSSPTITNVTIADNVGGAIYDQRLPTGEVKPRVINAILWNNGTPEVSENIGGISLDHVITDDAACPVTSVECSSLIGEDPRLQALSYSGGTTPTMKPGAGSSAIDTGDDVSCAAFPETGFDQRGVVRPQGAHCDIGAVEYSIPDDRIFDSVFEIAGDG